MEACVKCGLCTAACPVAAVSPTFPGPKFLGPELERLWAARPPEAPAPAVPGIAECTYCQVCQSVCPHGVPVAHLIARHRDTGGRQRLRDRLLSRPDRARRLGRAGNALLARRAVRAVLEHAIGLDRAAPLPRLAARPLPRGPWPEAPLHGPRVALLADCVTTWYQPEVGRAAATLLSRLGYRVEVVRPAGGCCGAALVSGGRLASAAALARRALPDLLALARQGVPLLACNSTCGPTVQREWAEVLGLAPAGEFRAAVADACAFLVERHTPAQLRRAWGPLAAGPAVVYHTTCRQRAWGHGSPGLRLLRAVLPGPVAPMHVACCGAAGAYAFKRERHQVSQAIGAEALEALERAREGRDAVLATDSGTCAVHLAGLGGLPARHPLALVAERLPS